MRKICISLCSLLIIASACKDPLTVLEPDEAPQEVSGAYQFAEAQTFLGEKVEIPYTIENLQKAWALLPPETKAAITEEDYAPTHYYVRFAPKNMYELDLLRNLSPRIILSEVPLDREVVRGGIYYHDPSLPADVPTYQYATISIKRWEELDTLSVKHEILLKAFMPDYDDNPETKSFETEYVWRPEVEALLKKAYEMTGNEYDEPGATKGATWYPSGYIKSYDNFAGMIPIANVRVRGTHFLTVKETLTSSSGYFVLGSFNNSVTLKVIWESGDWDIRYGLMGQATYDGPTLNGTMWFLNIPSDQTGSTHMATMHRAANRMFYGFISGLSRSSYNRKLKMSYMESTLGDGTQGGNFTPISVLGSNPDIQIAGYDQSGSRINPVVFSSTCHELGHAAHYTSGNYSNCSDQQRESWARFVQYYLTILEYTDLGCVAMLSQYDILGRLLPDLQFNFQALPPSFAYTPLFIDLYDDYNQATYYGNVPEHPNDIISGVPPQMLEGIVFSTTNFSEVESWLFQYADDYPGNPYNITHQSVVDIIELYYLQPVF